MACWNAGNVYGHLGRENPPPQYCPYQQSILFTIFEAGGEKDKTMIKTFPPFETSFSENAIDNLFRMKHVSLIGQSTGLLCAGLRGGPVRQHPGDLRRPALLQDADRDKPVHPEPGPGGRVLPSRHTLPHSHLG